MNFNANLLDVIRRIIAKETVFLKHFEGVVIDDKDPKLLGRVKPQLPELLWLTPDTIPWVYPEHGSATVVPPIGASVVVYFLRGDAAHPIYRGGTSERLNTRLSEYRQPATAVLFQDDGITLLWNRTEKIFTVKTRNKVIVEAPQVLATGGTLVIDGSVAPTGGGPFCGLPNCAFSGAPHIGNTVTNT